MMPGLFLPFSLLIMGVLALWTTAMALLIMFDLHRMRQSGQRFVWYERPLLWFAVCGISLGLSLVSSTLLVRGSLSDLLYWSLIFGPLILFTLSLYGGLIVAMRPLYKKVSIKAETRLKQLDESGLVSVAKSRSNENQTVLMMIGTTILLGMIALMDLISLAAHLTQGQFALGEVIMLLIFLLLLLIRSLILRRWAKRFNQRRSTLAAESRRPEASQPIPLEPLQFLLSPLVLRLKWWVINCSLFLFGAALFLFWLSFINVANSFSAMYIPLFISLQLAFKLVFGLRERVEVTNHGLVVLRGAGFAHQKQQMPWQTARLFTCYKTPGFFGDKTMITYELASSSQVVQWTRTIDTHSLFTPWKLERSMDEYDRQMQELCACITKQTGLQLHDLSEEKSIMREQEMRVQSYQ